MLKAELEERYKQLKKHCEYLENQVDQKEDYIIELENDLYRYVSTDPKDTKRIYNVDNLLHRMILDNLYTPRFEEFLNEYLRYYNEEE